MHFYEQVNNRVFCNEILKLRLFCFIFLFLFSPSYSFSYRNEVFVTFRHTLLTKNDNTLNKL